MISVTVSELCTVFSSFLVEYYEIVFSLLTFPKQKPRYLDLIQQKYGTVFLLLAQLFNVVLKRQTMELTGTRTTHAGTPPGAQSLAKLRQSYP